MTEQLARSADDWAAENSVRALYFLARCDDPGTMRSAQSHNYNLVDIRITLERNLDLQGADSMEDSLKPALRRAVAADIPVLQSIARAAHTNTRFSNDPHFSAGQARHLYERWISLECQGRAEQVLVAVSDGDAPSGYISCHVDKFGNGFIGLLAVSEEFRGKGLGLLLVRGALEWFARHGGSRVSVVTQGNNRSAQRVYQRCGFFTQDIQLWYHKWFS